MRALRYRLRVHAPIVDTTIIVATPRRQWTNRPLQRATIEVDRETKAIRKLVEASIYDGLDELRELRSKEATKTEENPIRKFLNEL